MLAVDELSLATISKTISASWLAGHVNKVLALLGLPEVLADVAVTSKNSDAVLKLMPAIIKFQMSLRGHPKAAP